MSKNYKSIEWKTAVCLVFSVGLHAGLIYYVALTQFGNGSSDVNQAGVAAPVEFQTVAPTEPIPVSNETPAVKEEVKVEAPKSEPKSESVKPAIKPEPKIEVSRPVTNDLPAPKSKIAKVLPKKVVAPISNDSPVVVAKNEEKQPEPEIEKEKMEEVMPVEKVESMNIEKEVAHEKAVREELVEKILKDEPNPEQLTIEQGTPKIVEQEPAPAPAPVVAPEAKPAPAATTQAQQPAPTAKGDAKTTVASTAPSNEGKALPVKNDSELKAMPGNKDPQYSSNDRLARRQGEVKFMAEVAADGSISNIRILKSSGHRSLDLAAYSAFKSYRYYPGQQSYVVKSFVFTLKGPAQVLPSRLGTRTQAAN